MMDEINIIGAGFAGLITACAIPDAPIFEAGVFQQKHQALLRFRDTSVSDLTGIPFKEVTVHKEIFSFGDSYDKCNCAFANLYSKKVSGVIENRSIWDLNTVQRYIAPPDFYCQLVSRHHKRIKWQSEIVKDTIGKSNTLKMINTAPLPVIMAACGLDTTKFEFKSSEIEVTRYVVSDIDVYQTIYFPDESLRVYRASLTGNLLIVESIKEADHIKRCDPVKQHTPDEELYIVLGAFGINGVRCHAEKVADTTTTQKYGKIIPLPKQTREAILYTLTREYNVFSIGRFATWRNILLDDVVKDIGVVKRMIAATDYGRELVLMNR